MGQKELVFKRMFLSKLLFCFLFLSFSQVSPLPGDKTEFVKKTVKDVTKKGIQSMAECAKTCNVGAFYWCDPMLVVRTRCRFTPLTWFLMIGLPLIILGIVV